jgi:L-iditol 2-dehydrogenase
MKAAVFTAPNTIKFFSNYQDPILADGFILRIRASGVCATDIKALSGTRPGMQPPMILGHEFAGEILESAIPEYRAGERVSVAPYAGCGLCDFCLDDREDLCKSKVFLSDGAFAEKVAVPKLLALKTAWKIPDSVSFEEASMAEPLACVVLSMRNCRWEPGWNILVVGGGFMGLLHVLVSSAWGASNVLVSEPNAFRRSLAERLGAVVFDPTGNSDIAKWTAAETGGKGPDVVITAVGSSEVVESVIDVARPGGVVNVFGGLPKDKNLSVSSYAIHYKSISLIGTSGFRTRDYKLASEIIASQTIDLKPLISTNFPLEKADEAFEKAKQGDSMKIIVSQK